MVVLGRTYKAKSERVSVNKLLYTLCNKNQAVKRVHYRVVTRWVSISSCCWDAFYAKYTYKHNFDEYYSCGHNMHKNK
jgi:hypothetical protein